MFLQRDRTNFINIGPSSTEYARRSKYLLAASISLLVVSCFVPGVPGLVLASLALVASLASMYNIYQANKPQPDCATTCAI